MKYYNLIPIEDIVHIKLNEYINKDILFNIYFSGDPMFNISTPWQINASHIKEINVSYIEHLQSLPAIPKKLHIAWNDKNVIQSKTKLIQNGLKSFIKLNPDWKILIYTDNEIEQYLRNKLSKFDYLLIKNRHIIEKIDLFRLLIVYFQGGMYVDIDRLFSVKMDEIITKQTKILLPTHYNINFAQDIMCSSSLNMLFKLAIELNLSKRRMHENMNDVGSNLDNVLQLGPQTYWEAVTKTLFDILIFDGGDYPKQNEPVVIKMRDLLNENKYIKTYMETWCDTILYHTDNLSECQSIDKTDLWKETNNKLHWEQEMQAAAAENESDKLKK